VIARRLKRGAAVLGPVVGAILAGVLGYAAVLDAWAAGRGSYASLATFARVLTTIEERHIDSPSGEDLIHSAIEGMVGQLDRHSLYIRSGRRGWLAQHADGQAIGVGLELRAQDGLLVVDRVVPGSPAELGGLLEGDVLLSIDDQAFAADALSAAATALEGARGAAVRLEVRSAEGPPRRVEVVRDTYIDVPVRVERDGAVAYVRIDAFSRGVADRVAEELARLHAEAPLGGLILDLRGNPGGLMDEAGRLVDLFCDSGLVLETRDRAGAVLDRYEAHPEPSDRSEPLVVIVDEMSASAAELTAGALRGLGRAQIVGAPSYGKGSVQHVFAFEDGAALKLTVGRYALPGGEEVRDGLGVAPDLRVDRPRRLRGAALRAATEAERAAPSDQGLRAAIEAMARPEDWELAPIPRVGDLRARRGADPQLEAAWRTVAAPR
jgi:carboxyl-terminal processing protease